MPASLGLFHHHDRLTTFIVSCAAGFVICDQMRGVEGESAWTLWHALFGKQYIIKEVNLLKLSRILCYLESGSGHLVDDSMKTGHAARAGLHTVPSLKHVKRLRHSLNLSSFYPTK